MKRFIVLFSFLQIFYLLAAQYVVSGGENTPFLAEDDTRNRIQVYLLNGLAGAEISFTGEGAHQWFKYSENALSATPVSSIQSGNTSYITDVEDGCGYFTGEPTDPKTSYIWIIDYSRYAPTFFNLEAQEEDDRCEYLKILADVEAEQLNYRLPTGAPAVLQRIYHLQYQTMEWDDDLLQFVPIDKDLELRGIIAEIIVEAPLMNTMFTLTGDSFAAHFGMEQAIRSAEYKAVAVAVNCTAKTDREYAENETHASGDALGGSAPIEYTFTAIANEPTAAFFNWKMFKRDLATGNYVQFYRYDQKVMQYTFNESGDFRLQLEVSDKTLSCVDSSQVFTILIGESKMEIPNAFSPGTSPGINDELRVSYASITNFKASVYNRWGNLLFHWEDPAKGWDGRVNGRYVPSGTYYVIVEYRDSTGKKRTASQSVSILRASEDNNSTTTSNSTL
ncbi:MAG: gliding motility-associated C-terminal domain-containing protein [Dysgonamonadaceae bacterium]|jgi:gliding motility-associated-like protein|nr:gliding motility-associated C-terminal domain-containing protein [Dysgonamonadaceae bacterium]